MKTISDHRFMFFVMHLGVGGAQKIASFIMNALVAEGAEVSVVCYYKRAENVQLDPRVKRIYLDIDPSPVNIGLGEKIKVKLSCVSVFAAILKSERPDCAVMFGPDPLPNIALTTSRFQGKVIECERGDINARNRLFRAILKRYMRRSDLAVFQMPGAMEGYGHFLPARVRVIANPCEYRADLKRDLRQRDNRVVSAGRLVPEKGFAELIKAFAVIADSYPELSLCIYGDGEERGSLESLIISLGLEGRVNLPGSVPDVGSQIVNARLFVLSSYFEGLPNTLIEAMSLGVPVVASDCTPGGARFLTKDGTIGGMIVERGSVDSLKNGIAYMLENPERAELLGKRGMNIASEFAPDIIVESWKEALTEVFR